MHKLAHRAYRPITKLSIICNSQTLSCYTYSLRLLEHLPPHLAILAVGTRLYTTFLVDDIACSSYVIPTKDDLVVCVCVGVCMFVLYVNLY